MEYVWGVSGSRHDYEMVPRIAAPAWLGLGGPFSLTGQWVLLYKSLTILCP